MIDDISPNPANPADPVAFSGHGEDSDGSDFVYHWESSIDGELSHQSSFTTSSLSAGTHVISFLVQDSKGLWSEAATKELRVGAAATEVVIDNRDLQTSRTGTWQASGGTAPYGPDSLWARNGATFTWIFNPSQPGNYDVSMWWSGWSTRATNVSVAIDHANGRATLSINQSQNAGKWNSLGSYYFTSSGRVTITAASGSTVSTCADAVKFTVAANPGLPVADFAADKTSGGAPLTVQFTDQSVGTISNWLWDFGDGGKSSRRNPSHQYTTAGTYKGPGRTTADHRNPRAVLETQRLRTW